MSRLQLKILVIDGSPATPHPLAEVLARSEVRAELEEMRTLSAALARLARGHADLVLLTLAGDGRGARSRIGRILAVSPDLPVLVLAPAGDDKLLEAALAAGAQELLPSPPSAAALSRAIRAALARKRHELAMRQRQTAHLEQSQRSFRAVLDAAPVAIFTTDPENVVRSWNRAAESLFGYRRSEVVGCPYPLVPADRAEEHKELVTRYARGQPVVGFETVRLRKDGTRVDVAIYSAAVRNARGQVTETLGILTDITERHQAEEDRRASRTQLRALNARLLRIREEARARIAREIHDQLGGDLTGLNLLLGALREKLPAELAEQRRLVDAMMGLVAKTLRAVRDIASELHPPVLDRGDLAAALQWQVAEFTHRSGIRCRLRCDLQGAKPDAELSTAIFRILQESLTNVARHADADRVSVSLTRHGEALRLAVRDNGKGFVAPQAPASRALGILGMQERARDLGGALEVCSKPGAGTTVRLSIPLSHPAAGNW